MAYKIIRTNNVDPDFHQLIPHLDADLYQRYGKIMDDFSHLNKTDGLTEVVVIYHGDEPVACGAFKPYNTECIEIKRIFVHSGHRRRGLAKRLMHELESTAKAAGFKAALLETGGKQPEAISLYQSCGYELIENHPLYVGLDISVCMHKDF